LLVSEGKAMSGGKKAWSEESLAGLCISGQVK